MLIEVESMTDTGLGVESSERDESTQTATLML